MNTPSSNSKDGRNDLLEDILQQVNKLPDVPVKDIVRGRHHIMVRSDHAGLCARIHARDQGMEEDRAGDGLTGFRGSVLELAGRFLRPAHESQETISCAMAAINSILPVPEDALPVKGQQLMERHGKGKNVVCIGHFPFVERMGREFRHMYVLEKYLRPGDLSVENAEDVLPHADVVALTATTLLNGTCEGLLRLIPGHAFTIMLGPSTPFAPCLFDRGIDALAGCRVSNPYLLKSSIQKGEGGYHGLQGTEPFTWVRGQGTEVSRLRSSELRRAKEVGSQRSEVRDQ